MPVPKQMEHLLLLRSQHRLFLSGRGRELLHAQPNTPERLAQTFCRVFEPARELAARAANGIEAFIIARPILPVELVHRENVMRIEAAPIQLPERKHSSHAPVAISERMN